MGDRELVAKFKFATQGLDADELKCLLILGKDEIQYNKSISIDEVKSKYYSLLLH